MGIANLVATEKREDWHAMWQTHERGSGETEASFTKDRKRLKRRIRDFQPTYIDPSPRDGSWMIAGCMSSEADAPQKGVFAVVQARWTGSRWYFTNIAIAISDVGKPTPRGRECVIH